MVHEGDTPPAMPPPVSTGVPARMKVGFNYPWAYEEYGAQIGPYPHVPWQQWVDERKLSYSGQEKTIPKPPLFNNIDRNLDRLNKMGIRIVRWFLLGNGFNYGLAGMDRLLHPRPPSNFYTSEWEFDPPLKADPRFAYHLEELLKRFKTAGMQMIPSFIDFSWVADFNNGAYRSGSRTPGRRTDCITDQGKRFILLTFLGDLLKVSRTYAAQIFAWEVCNEPFWMQFPTIPHASPLGLWVHRTNDPSQPFRAGAVAKDVLKDFLKEAIQTIEAGGFKGKSTVGHRYYDDIAGTDPFPAGSMPQFHYYADPGRDPDKMPTFSGASTTFLGEFASDGAGPDQNRPWKQDLPTNDTTFERLNHLGRLGCKLALIWPDKAGVRTLTNPDGSEQKTKEDWIKLQEETRRQIVQFTGGVFMPIEPNDP